MAQAALARTRFQFSDDESRISNAERDLDEVEQIAPVAGRWFGKSKVRWNAVGWRW